MDGPSDDAAQRETTGLITLSLTQGPTDENLSRRGTKRDRLEQARLFSTFVEIIRRPI
jgi:hypothetical protein